MKQRILLVEDEEALRETLAYRLRTEEYQVLTATDGVRAVAVACATPPDLVILDLMLPGLDGYGVCKQLRSCCAATATVPIIMLTARTEESDKITGLEVGADDYITKPFSWLELRTRIRALLRRRSMAGEATQQGELTIGELRIDLDQRVAWRGETPLDLTAKLFDLLVYFARYPGTVLTRARLLEHVWGYDFEGDARTVDVYVRWLRERIEPEPATPQILLTVRGVGYRLKV